MSSGLVPRRPIGAGHDDLPAWPARERYALHRLAATGTTKRDAAKNVDRESVFEQALLQLMDGTY